jgi:hypothetical protein
MITKIAAAQLTLKPQQPEPCAVSDADGLPDVGALRGTERRTRAALRPA